jgi:hypothetical protein
MSRGNRSGCGRLKGKDCKSNIDEGVDPNLTLLPADNGPLSTGETDRVPGAGESLSISITVFI